MSGGSPGPEHRSSLASLLLNLNSSAMSSISATINGAARLVDAGSDEEQFYRQQHLENNTFDSEGASFGNMFQGPNSAIGNGNGGTQRQQGEDGGRGCFVAGEEVRVIVVGIQDVRISDWKGGVRDWVIAPDGGQAQPQVNGGQ